MHSKLHIRMSCWCLTAALMVAVPSIIGKPISSPKVNAISFTQPEPAEHPLSLLRQGILDGWAKISIAVDADGQLLDAIVTGYSHEEFGQATLEAVRGWEFTPASINGEPVSSVTHLNFNYNRDSNGAKVLPTSLMDYLKERSSIIEPVENKLVRLDKLDRIPIPLHIISPAFSQEDAQNHTGEKVVVRFYIDEKGNVRLPTLMSADNSDIARQALAAVAQWRFEPPTYQGKPVITRASQEFLF